MIRKYGLYAVWVLAVFGTLGTLYVSDILNIEPCSLCWYQRICLYPLAIIAGRAAWLGFHGIAAYLMPQTWIGLGLALYHVAIQGSPTWQPISLSPAGPNCAIKVSLGLGFFTLPILSVIVFSIINALLLAIWRISKKEH